MKKISNYLLALLCSIVVYGCSSTPSIVMETEHGPSASDRRLKSMQTLISKKVSCENPIYKYKYTEDKLHEMTACGETFEHILVCAGYCHWLSVNELKKRAQFDLNCKSEIDVIKINDKVWGAVGCGNRASYIGMWSGGSIGWVQNSAANSSSSVNNSSSMDAANSAAQAGQGAANHLMHHTPPPPPPPAF